MAVEVGPIISFLAQRIVAAPPEVEVPKPTARATPVKRFREGLLTEATFRLEMATLGWGATDIDRSLVQARLERAFDDFQDRLSALEDAFNKDLVSFEELKVRLLELIPDQAKALIVLDKMDFAKRPKPKLVTPEEPPTLTVGRLLAAYKAGVLAEPGLRSELAERGYSPEDIDIMIATETARLPKPKPPARKLLSLAELKSMLALGLLDPEEFRAELIERKYTPADADALLGLELSRIMARVRVEPPTLTVSQLLTAFRIGTLAEPRLRTELIERGYSPEDIDLLIATELARLPKPKAPALRLLSLGDLRAMLGLGIITPEEFRAELLGRNYSPEDADSLLALELSRIMARAPA